MRFDEQARGAAGGKDALQKRPHHRGANAARAQLGKRVDAAHHVDGEAAVVRPGFGHRTPTPGGVEHQLLTQCLAQVTATVVGVEAGRAQQHLLDLIAPLELEQPTGVGRRPSVESQLLGVGSLAGNAKLAGVQRHQ